MGLVIAIDPGLMTGMATANGDVVTSWQVFPWQVAVDYVEHELLQTQGGFMKHGREPNVAIVYEQFIPRPGAHTWQPEALHCIGALEFLAWKFRAPIEHNMVSAAKSFSTDAKLKKLGWFNPTEGGHANDALRHLLLYQVKHGLLDPEVLLVSTS